MSLLELEHVAKRHREGSRERIVLGDVSLHVRSTELVMIWGARRSDLTTLLRVAAGIESPDEGIVRFDGRDLAKHVEHTLGSGIGYVQKALRSGEEPDVLQQVAAPLLARGTAVDISHSRAREALARIAAERLAAMRAGELGPGERVRVALARTLSLSPRLVIIDEPVGAVELGERDLILECLRRLAGEGLAVLASTGEPAELAGAHRALTLSEGELRGESVPDLATVVALRRAGA